ncbi:hypothetical protein P7K49_011963, partial [Saguinus oedipus]
GEVCRLKRSEVWYNGSEVLGKFTRLPLEKQMLLSGGLTGRCHKPPDPRSEGSDGGRWRRNFEERAKKASEEESTGIGGCGEENGEERRKKQSWLGPQGSRNSLLAPRTPSRGSSL